MLNDDLVTYRQKSKIDKSVWITFYNWRNVIMLISKKIIFYFVKDSWAKKVTIDGLIRALRRVRQCIRLRCLLYFNRRKDESLSHIKNPIRWVWSWFILFAFCALLRGSVHPHPHPPTLAQPNSVHWLKTVTPIKPSWSKFVQSFKEI